MWDIKTPIMTRIEAMVKDVAGWSPLDQLYTLFCLVYFTADVPGDVVEIGSWCGRSTSALGLAATLSGNTRVHCVDLFPAKDDWRQNDDGTYWFEVMIAGQRLAGYREQTVWREPFERDIAPIYAQYASVFDAFNATVSRNDLGDVVRVFRGDSSMFAEAVGEGLRCKLAFIDGDHGYDAVCRDIRNVERFLVPGGWLCFDDAFSHYEGVDRAINDLVVGNPEYELCQQMSRKFLVARRKRESWKP